MSQFGNMGKPDKFSGRDKPGVPPYGKGGDFNKYPEDPYAPESPDFVSEEEEYAVANRLPRKPGAPPRANTGRQAVEIQKIEPGKRVIALIFDSLAFYMCGMALTVVPFVVHFVNISLAWILLLLIRDWLFDGRGIGKNLMGLQVVDAKTGNPCSLKQSVLRNIIILAPFAVLQVISVILTFVPISWLDTAVRGVVNAVGMVYVAVVLPVECYRAYSRDDSLRLGDVWAGTAIIESHMDFSNPFSK